ncbi:DEAD/DEAH box helicase [Paenibacillus piri]|uniref:Helicase SNF n=1 Tax=Paenibacillus piri TaxID=2547395 RepID=A0A4R5KBT3_9BACL|nr:DEAD/DEAH box helicase [Paenibacillus piri]TDF92362.1 helicase SNF [Paenibacillus piri]
MSFQLTERVIKLLCGSISFERGEAYYAAGKVTFTNYDPRASLYEAEVSGSSDYRVIVEIDGNGDVDAECECSAFYSYEHYCKHIAAVLLSIHGIEHNGRSPVRSYASKLRLEQPGGGIRNGSGRREARLAVSPGRASSALADAAGDDRLTQSMMGLFSGKPPRATGAGTFFDTRTALDVEFICKPYAYKFGNYLFGIELKIGPGKLYIVQKIKQFLDRVDRRETYSFSKHFIYDPELHSFRQEDDAVIRQLIRLCRQEQIYKELATPSYLHAAGGGDRLLLVPPAAWETAAALLAKASAVKLEHNGNVYEGIETADGPVPLHFGFDQAPTAEPAEGYQLDVQGLERITVLESYGLVLSEGKLLKLPPESCSRLAELKRMFEASRMERIRIRPEQMEPFMEKVIPGLMKLGSVRIAPSVSDRIVHAPLKARLYLDRVKDRLLAGLEFQYGDIAFNPLEGSGHKRGSDRILMRDGEQERQIMELMDCGLFAKTEGGYFLEEEEAEYEFLYHIVPQLEKLADVYATSAVKARLFTKHAPPKISVDVYGRTEWLEFQFDMEGIPESEIRELLKTLEEKRKYYRLPDGALLPLESEAFQEIIRFMNEVGVRQADFNETGFRLPVVRGLHLIDAQRQGDAVKLGKAFRRLLDHVRNPDHLDFPVPDSLDPVLRDYQKYGFQWLKTLAHYGFGGILADDMGLGKTVQSIALLVSVLPEIRSGGQPALIVAPASLLYNWYNELNKFAPDIRAAIADGDKKERGGILKSRSQIDVIITSYPLLRKDLEMYAGRPFHTLILDEAQAFKNYATQTAQAVRLLQARNRFALTGTPVENTLEELWSIFDAVFPGLFPGRKAFNELSRETVARRVRPFILRRLKTDVLKELPEKIESLQASELFPEQKKLYAAYLAKLRHETLKHLNESNFQKNRIKILAGLTRLRQLCCHPALFVEGYAGGSAKMEQLLEIVDECRSAGKRMLIFSQFTEMLSLIGRELGVREAPYFYLDGQTAASERVELCDRFNRGERDLFLISLKAGGTGLNLTGADTVLLYDLWWNPAVEQQAADRAHRIGQKNVVQVIRLVARGTVEDKMYELQQKKKNLIDEVIQPGQESVSALTEQEIKDILMIG